MALTTINVDELKQFLDYITNKEQSGNTMNPVQYNMLLRRGMEDQYSWLYGSYQSYLEDHPYPKVAYEQTQLVKDFLRIFKETESISVDAQGKMIIPDNYNHYTNIDFLYKKNNPTTKKVDIKRIGVEIIDDDKFTGRINHPIKIVRKDRLVIGNFHNTYVEYYPNDIASVDFTYLRNPVAPLWAYTIVSDVAIYDPGNSVQIELPVMLTNQLARIILSYIGINMREEKVVNYAETIKTKGV